MISRNKLIVAKNMFQGKYKKVLCVCSMGVLRSPTTALVLSMAPYNYNTRAVGIGGEEALIPLTPILLEWADEIVCMDEYQEHQLQQQTDKPIINLRIGDIYNYRDPKLEALITTNYERKTKEHKGVENEKS